MAHLNHTTTHLHHTDIIPVLPVPSSIFLPAQSLHYKYLKMEAEGVSLEELEVLTLGSLRKAVMDGDVVNGSLMAGQIAGMIQDELSCKEIITSIVSEAERLMNRK